MNDSERAWIVARWITGVTQQNVGDEIGITGTAVCNAIREFCDKWSRHNVTKEMIYDNERRKVALGALHNYYLSSDRAEIKQPVTPDEWDWWNDPHDNSYGSAREEHAWLLRAEGLKLQKIADRLGVSKERVRQMIVKFGWRVKKAVRKVVWPGWIEKRIYEQRVRVNASS
jgi:predicted transcriptional regulator